MTADTFDRTELIAAWRDRLAWQRPHDPQRAEAGIRRVYALIHRHLPDTVVWARGPREAVQTVAWFAHPRWAMLQRPLAGVALGFVFWIAFAAAVYPRLPLPAEAPPLYRSVLQGALIALVLPILVYVTRSALPAVLQPRPRSDPLVAALYLALFLVATIHATVMLRATYGAIGAPGFVPWLIAAGAIGLLPGMLHGIRVARILDDAPPDLRDLHRQSNLSAELQAELERVRLRARQTAQRSERRHPGAVTLAPFNPLANIPLARAYRHAWAIAGGGRWAHLDGILDTAQAVYTLVTTVDAGARTGALGIFADLAFAVDRLYPLSRTAVAVAPPATVKLDADGRPHAADGPALAWADGTSVYCWHGAIVPPDLIDGADQLGLARIQAEPDPALRRIMIEIYGAGRYMREAGAVAMQRDPTGTLYRLEQPGDEPLVMVRVVNSTPGPDGSSQEFWLRVPPTVTTAHEGVAWTFGLTPEEYRPAAQS